jgi:hypothetical protein
MVDMTRLTLLIDDEGGWDAQDTPVIRQISAFTGIDLDDL